MKNISLIIALILTLILLFIAVKHSLPQVKNSGVYHSQLVMGTEYWFNKYYIRTIDQTKYKGTAILCPGYNIYEVSMPIYLYYRKHLYEELDVSKLKKAFVKNYKLRKLRFLK